MDKIKLVIVEDNKDLCQILVSYINENFYDAFEIVGIAHDGKKGLSLISITKPDIALIDIVLPILDGISILEKMHSLHLISEVCCIMLTAVSQDDVTRRAVDLGAKYYFLKPFDNEALIHRIIEIHQLNMKKRGQSQNATSSEISYKRASDASPEIFATNILQKIGIPANLTGYYYLRMALILCIEDKSLLSGLTKVLYPSIAKEFKTTGQRVERSIRHSIEKAWSAGCSEAYYKILGRDKHVRYSKPSNGVFIMDLVDYYKINYSKK